MPVAMDGRWIACAALAVALAGCSRELPPPFPVWAKPASLEAAAERGSNAFYDYTKAAELAEEAAAKYLDRNNFTPAMRQNCLSLLEPALTRIRTGTNKRCTFEFLPRSPDEVAPYQRGWRLIGRALVWRVEEAAIREDYAKAVETAVLATTFGFDLTGGDALDASLGMEIVNEVRRAIAPELTKMASQELLALESGVSRALMNRPPIGQTLQHEHENMLMAVQFVQDCLRDNETQVLQDLLGSDVRAAVDYLRNLQSKPSKRVHYFERFAREADRHLDWLQSQAVLPAYKREPIPSDDLDEERPWRRFSKHFFSAGRPLLDLDISTVARTRLLILECGVLAHIRKNKTAPANLAEAPSALRIDPYTGRDFIYRAEGRDYRLYSLGANFKDDLGDTDESYASPDIVLEK